MQELQELDQTAVSAVCLGISMQATDVRNFRIMTIFSTNWLTRIRSHLV